MNELELLIGKVARNAFALGFGLGVLFVLIAGLIGFSLVSFIH
jgi:hypothetical protein